MQNESGTVYDISPEQTQQASSAQSSGVIQCPNCRLKQMEYTLQEFERELRSMRRLPAWAAADHVVKAIEYVRAAIQARSLGLASDLPKLTAEQLAELLRFKDTQDHCDLNKQTLWSELQCLGLLSLVRTTINPACPPLDSTGHFLTWFRITPKGRALIEASLQAAREASQGCP